MLRGQLDSLPPGTAGDTITVHSFSFWYRFNAGTHKIRLTIEHESGTSVSDFDNVRDYTKASVVFSPALVIAYDDADVNALRLHPLAGGSGWMYIDDVLMDLDVYTAP